MAKRLADVITSLTDAELFKRLDSGFNTTAINVEISRRGVQRPKVVKSTVSRGRGHARRATRPSGGRVNLSEVIDGTLRPPSVGQFVSPWIRHATGRGDVI